LDGRRIRDLLKEFRKSSDGKRTHFMRWSAVWQRFGRTNSIGAAATAGASCDAWATAMKPVGNPECRKNQQQGENELVRLGAGDPLRGGPGAAKAESKEHSPNGTDTCVSRSPRAQPAAEIGLRLWRIIQLARAWSTVVFHWTRNSDWLHPIGDIGSDCWGPS
jgi:hypothetical protein